MRWKQRWRTSIIEATDWAVEHEHIAGVLDRLIWGTDTFPGGRRREDPGWGCFGQLDVPRRDSNPRTAMGAWVATKAARC